MALTLSRINPTHEDFSEGLSLRNVLLTQSTDPDPYADQIQNLKSPVLVEETEAERDSHGRIWALDRAKIGQGSNEALFQRTLMMDLIGRHLFIYNRERAKSDYLDFSVEELWTCPPMPSRAYYQGDPFLSQPKPDLAVCFRREATIPNNLWFLLPKATRGLACFERKNATGHGKIFNFLTIEAKKDKTSTDDVVGKCQSLNNASQALHNMFEFFREAGREDTFFAKVRFFSAVASSEGVLIRIHRATEERSGQGLIVPGRQDYPLEFEFQDFAHIPKSQFDRATVLKTFEKIMIGYGVGVLRDLIQTAAAAIVEKLKSDPKQRKLRNNPHFYRYDQIFVRPKSGIPSWLENLDSTQAVSTNARTFEAPSHAYSQANNSTARTRSGSATPTQDQIPGPSQPTTGRGEKRPRSPPPGKMSASGPERKRRAKGRLP
ncbi:hypothetical protein CLAIMM_10261 [Cladophialophora immunda]|nr:hypothetical protein CLAIMM_10261 [Cladophialophora immunda]